VTRLRPGWFEAARGITPRRIAGGFAHRLAIVGKGLVEHRLQRSDQGNVQPIHPDHGPGCLAAVIMPRPRRGEDEISRHHRALLAFDGGIGPLSLHDEANGGGRVPMRRGAFSRQQQLHGSRQGMGRGFSRHAGVGQTQDAAFHPTIGGDQLPRPHEQRLDRCPAPAEGEHPRLRLVRHHRPGPGRVEMRAFDSCDKLLHCVSGEAR